MWTGRRRVVIWATGVACLVAFVTLALGDYFAGEARAFTPVREADPPGDPPPPLAAVFWSGDMGMHIGFGSDLPERLAEAGIPVLAVSSPVVFGRQRTADEARAAVAGSLAEAINRSGARSVVLIGFSFGADVVAASAGQLPQGLRRRIAQVVLVGPGKDIHFHANPFGLFYLGRSEADSGAAAAGLKGLPTSCIYASAEANDSLCREPALSGARLTEIADGHMMLAHREEVTRAVVAAVLHPPEPLR